MSRHISLEQLARIKAGMPLWFNQNGPHESQPVMIYWVELRGGVAMIRRQMGGAVEHLSFFPCFYACKRALLEDNVASQRQWMEAATKQLERAEAALQEEIRHPTVNESPEMQLVRELAGVTEIHGVDLRRFRDRARELLHVP